MSSVKKSKKGAYSPQAKKSVPAETKGGRRPPRHGLGRGLSALMGELPGQSVPEEKPVGRAEGAGTAATAPGQDSGAAFGEIDEIALPPGANHMILDVPVSDILRSPWQPRQSFDEEALKELTDSIRSNGLIQPLVCRKNSEHRFELIAGERRLRAVIDAGLSKVPVVLIEAEDRRAAEMAIIENIQRQDLNVIEEAEGYRTLADSFNMTQQEVADRVGKARASIANAMRLLELPDEVKQMVAGGFLSTGHAKVLLSLTDATEQTLLARKSVKESLTVRQLERVIKRRREELEPSQTRRVATPDLPESYLQALSDRLHEHFGTHVKILSGMTQPNGKHTQGSLEIAFYDNDDLDRLLELLGVSLN